MAADAAEDIPPALVSTALSSQDGPEDPPKEDVPVRSAAVEVVAIQNAITEPLGVGNMESPTISKAL